MRMVFAIVAHLAFRRRPHSRRPRRASVPEQRRKNDARRAVQCAKHALRCVHHRVVHCHVQRGFRVTLRRCPSYRGRRSRRLELEGHDSRGKDREVVPRRREPRCALTRALARAAGHVHGRWLLRHARRR